MAPSWTGMLLGAVSLGVAAYFAVAAVRPGADRMAAAAHTAMALAMAGMFAGHAVTPSGLGAAVFAGVAAWFAAQLLRGTRGGSRAAACESRAAAGGPAHLVVAPAAMAVTYLTGGHGGAMSGSGGAGSAATAAVALALTGYFVWHALTCASRLGRRRPAPSVATTGTAPGTAAIASPAVAGARIEGMAHVVMSGLMAGMFLLSV